MNIVKRIVSKGSTMGYVTSDGGLTMCMCSDALYTEMMITALIKEGYKYYSRNADEIEDPNGNPICMLETMDVSDVDEYEWFASIDHANTEALTDAEAAKYYTFKADTAISFKTEQSYEINTREELIEYLEGLKQAFYTVNYSTDNRPLNAFVNPNALFTISELESNPELRQYFDVIIKRHHMRDYGAFRNLIKWLCSKGVLNTETPSTAEFLNAYYAWGPEGLRDKCTKIETKMNVDGVFTYIKDPLGGQSAESYVYDNRISKVSLVDGNEKIHFLHSHEDLSHISDVKDFGRSRIMVATNEQLMLIRRTENSGFRYQAIAGTLVSDVSDRLYITMVSDSGYTYVYKVSHNQMKIGLAFSNTSTSIYSTSDNFALSSVIPSVSIPIDAVRNDEDYYLWNLAIVKSAQLIKKKSHKAPVRSTTEYLLNDGVNPVAVIDMMAHTLSKNSGHRINEKYNLTRKDDDFTNALELYLKELPDYLLKAFNLSEEDLEDGINSFLELADVDDLRDRRDLMMANKIGPNDAGFDPTYKDYQTKFGRGNAIAEEARALTGRAARMYDAVDYYTKLKFVHDCLHGDLSVDFFGDGQLADLGASFKVAAECILTAVYAEYGDNVDKLTAENAVLNIDNSNIIDIDRIFKVRDRGLRGYMVDFAEYRKTRACENTWIWAYCTRVFREISNAPVSEQRPYLMELLVLENSKPDNITRKLLTECVKEAMNKTEFDEKWFGDKDTPMGNWNEKICASYSTEYIAAKLFFYVLAGGVKGEPVDGKYVVKMNMYDSQDLMIDLPVGVCDFIKKFDKTSHRRYITVYDYCKYEYNPNTTTGTFNICLVNADVDPWHVKPKKGYSIKSYSLLPNYYDQGTLDNANGVGFYQGGYDAGTICVSPLKGLYRSLFLPTYDMSEIIMWEDEARNAKDVSDLAGFMLPDQCEFIFAYVKRWALERKKAAAMGKRLVSIPLKQDIVYAPMAYSFCENVPSQEPTYTSDINFDDKQAQGDGVNTVISWKDYFDTNVAISTKQYHITEFSIHDINLDDIENIKDILSGEFSSGAPIVITGNYINVKGDTVMRVAASKLTQSDIDNFVSAGILKKINESKYFISAINGDFVLEI